MLMVTADFRVPGKLQRLFLASLLHIPYLRSLAARSLFHFYRSSVNYVSFLETSDQLSERRRVWGTRRDKVSIEDLSILPQKKSLVARSAARTAMGMRKEATLSG